MSNLFQNGTRNIKKNPLISWDWIWKGRLCMDCVYLICRHDAARCDWLYSVHRKIVFTDAMHLPGFCDVSNLLSIRLPEEFDVHLRIICHFQEQSHKRTKLVPYFFILFWISGCLFLYFKGVYEKNLKPIILFFKINFFCVFELF
jgi:hypothetical protein